MEGRIFIYKHDIMFFCLCQEKVRLSVTFRQNTNVFPSILEFKNDLSTFLSIFFRTSTHKRYVECGVLCIGGNMDHNERQAWYQRVAIEVDAWISSREGKALLERLHREHAFIQLGTDEEFGVVDIYVLTERGFGIATEPSMDKMSGIYAALREMEKEGIIVRRTKIHPISTIRAVTWAHLCDDGIADPDHFLDRLKMAAARRYNADAPPIFMD